MKQNKDELFNIESSSPLFSSLLGISGALLCADTLKNGALLCVFTTIVAMCLCAFGNIIAKKFNETLAFWSTMLLGALISLPLALTLGVFIAPEKAVLFAVVGVTVGYAVAKKEKSDVLGDELKSSLFFSLMYSVSVVIFSFLRELLADGSILGVELFDGIEFFKSFYGSIFVFVVVAVVYNAVSLLIKKGRDEE